jgi:hypothetical protein
MVGAIITDGQARGQELIINGPEFFLVIHVVCFDVNSKLKDRQEKLEYALQRMLTLEIIPQILHTEALNPRSNGSSFVPTGIQIWI